MIQEKFRIPIPDFKGRVSLSGQTNRPGGERWVQNEASIARFPCEYSIKSPEKQDYDRFPECGFQANPVVGWSRK